MSDASGSPATPGDGAGTGQATKLEATSPLWPTSKRRGFPAWGLGGALAALGALLYLVTAWTPWVEVTGTGADGQVRTYLLGPGDVANRLGSFGWSALSIAGVLLLPLVLRRPRALLSLLGLLGYGLWTLLAILTEPSLLAGVRLGGTVHLDPSFIAGSLTLTAEPHYSFAYDLHLASLALAVAGVVLLCVGAFRARRAGGPEHLALPHVSLRLPGMGLLTGALVLWLIGVFVFPWATVGCGGLPLVSAQCVGLPFGAALRYGLAGSTLVDPLLALYAAGLLLAGGAVLILIGIWWGRISGRLCAWIALWLAAATLLAALADAGVGTVVSAQGGDGLPTGAWSGDTGIAVTFIALVLGWIALIYLLVRVVRRPRARD